MRAGILQRVDRIAVPQGSWGYPDPARLVADRVGAPGARTHLVELGIPQQSLINEALAAVASGASEVAAVVGGEAKRWARDLERAGRTATETAQPGAVPDVTRHREGPLMEPVEVAHRLWDPVQQYAMIENALRAAEGRTLAQHRSEVADLWARFNRVARTNPDAAFPAPYGGRRDRHGVAVQPAPGLPVQQVALDPVDGRTRRRLCSSARWGRRSSSGCPPTGGPFPGSGWSRATPSPCCGARPPTRWPAMEVLGAAAAERIGRPVADAEIIELYSCFPAAVRVQQRMLGLDPQTTPTVTGGMAFAGGPFNNFVLQSMVPVIRALRAEPGAARRWSPRSAGS